VSISGLRIASLSGAVLSLLLSASQPILAQPTKPAAPDQAEEKFQARIDEAVRAIEGDARLKGLSHQQLQGVAEFVIGNLLYVSLHEMGHAVIDDMYLYVLGREEDAADSHATVTMLKLGGSFSRNVLVAATKGWAYSARRDQARGISLAFYDEHGLDKQRAYQIVCLMVGSAPDKFVDLANEAKMPEERQGTCQGDWSTASWGWNKALEPHRRAAGQPKTEIKVTYGEAADKDRLDIYAKALRSVRFLETIAEYMADQLVWSAPLALEAKTCGESNAYWSHPPRTYYLCYELGAEFAALYREYGDDWKPSTPKRSPPPGR
jgi:putative metallopeptidase DUF4344